MPNRLDDHRIPGIGPMRSARLNEAGLATLEQIVATKLQDLAAVPGFNLAVAERLIAHAELLLASAGERVDALVPVLTPPDPTEIIESAAVDKDDEAEAPALTRKSLRGLDAARRIEDSRGWLGRIRDGSRGIRPKARRKRLRKALDKLNFALESTQEVVIAHGLSRKASWDLLELLGQFDRELREYADGKAGKKRTRALIKHLKQTRAELGKRMR